jgi:hypothetical protein
MCRPGCRALCADVDQSHAGRLIVVTAQAALQDAHASLGVEEIHARSDAGAQEHFIRCAHGDHVVQGASALVRLHRYRLRTEHEYGGMLIPHTSETARFAGPYQLVGLCSHGYQLLGLSNPHCVLLQ